MPPRVRLPRRHPSSRPPALPCDTPPRATGFRLRSTPRRWTRHRHKASGLARPGWVWDGQRPREGQTATRSAQPPSAASCAPGAGSWVLPLPALRPAARLARARTARLREPCGSRHRRLEVASVRSSRRWSDGSCWAGRPSIFGAAASGRGAFCVFGGGGGPAGLP
jgi:hypothetical protein